MIFTDEKHEDATLRIQDAGYRGIQFTQNAYGSTTDFNVRSRDQLQQIIDELERLKEGL